MIISTTNAVSQPYTVVIVPRDAGVAKAAMLASRRFQQTTSTAKVSRVEEHSIIRITPHLLFMIFRRNEGLGNDAGIQEYIWEHYYHWNTQPVYCSES